MSKLFFDVTDLRFYLTHAHRLSGIQRVTVMVIEEAAKQLGGDNVLLAFVDSRGGSYCCLPFSALQEGTISSPVKLAAALGVVPAGFGRRPSVERYAKKPLKLKFHTRVRDLNAAFGNARHFEKRHTTIEAWQNSAVIAESWAQKAAQRFDDFFTVATAEDRLLLLDASWGEKLAATFHKRAHDSGIKVYSLIHDLIPVVTPEFVVGQQGLKFYNWLKGTLDYVDVYLANSEATAVDLRAFLDTYGADRPVGVVPLAQAGIPIVKAETELPESLKAVDRDAYSGLYEGFFVHENVRALIKRPFVLCVGTMEARKNLWSITQAWLRMIDSDLPHLPRLVFAGRPGWLNADFDRVMERTGYLFGWCEILHGPSDEELDYLYRKCAFTICTSYKEGWGLPIGESLSYGKTGVVSNVSSMPEVGGDLVEYCDPLSIASIEAACRKLIEAPEHRAMLEARIAETRLRSWSDVAQEMISAARA
ncbi:MAG: glycosyltransferase family 1 protein [Pseudomonadota bacterium]